ncbi:MAG: GGDEF domain-containing protein [Lysobacteraceae bacterium]|nr:MAG: GGDEF domain-containing protein [Xanthomonadaceae bacterium]
MMRLPTGLRWQVLGLLAVSGLLLLLLLWMLAVRHRSSHDALVEETAQIARAQLDEGLRQRAESMARMLARALVNPVYYFDLAQVGEVVRSVRSLPGVDYVLVFDARGRILHDGSRAIEGFGADMDDPLAPAALHARGLLFQQDRRRLEAAMPIRIGDERLGGVRVGLSRQDVEQVERAMLADLSARAEADRGAVVQLLAAVAALLVAGGGVLLFQLERRVLGPIRALAVAAREVGQGNHDVRLPGRRGDEIGDLERAFTRMAQALARHDREVLRLAYTDPLTGLANRLAFRERLEQRMAAARAAGESLALLFIDLDGFKRINDAMGHDAGDQVLEQVAARLTAGVESAWEGAQLARLGGDEFVVLAGGGVEHDRVRSFAEGLLQALKDPFHVHGQPVFLGASIGITRFPQDAAEARSLLKAGDLAMYQAKLAGRGCVRFFHAAMDRAVAESAQMEQALRGAWSRGELSLSFQPIYDLADRRLAGAESLLRWHHPVLGKVPPSVFVAVAERTGLIASIGREVLHAACRAAAGWRDVEGRAPFVSVNLSAVQLRQSGLVEEVAAVLEATGLPAQRLHLELTETAVMSDEEQVAELVERLRAMGVRIWLDDFGTGFSGLSHLRRVPVDGVKIDKSFVFDLLRDPGDLALTSAIIAMAHSLGVTVVAEGVESEAQFELLRERGCDYAQGFWLGRPLPGGEFDARHLAAE